MAKATTPAATTKQMRRIRREVDKFFDRNIDITETDALRVMRRLEQGKWTFADVIAIVRGGKLDG